MANKKQKNQRKQTPPQAEAPHAQGNSSSQSSGSLVFGFMLLFFFTFALILILPDLEQKIQYKDIEIPVSWVLWTILGIWYLVMSIRMMRN